MIKPPYESGFSAVELLITLFVGFLFIMMGYQLYSVSIQAGGEAREQAKASNVAYETLRRIQTLPSDILCSYAPPAIDVDNLKAKMHVTASCPFGPSTNLFLVTVKIVYNISAEEVTHAIYVSK